MRQDHCVGGAGNCGPNGKGRNPICVMWDVGCGAGTLVRRCVVQDQVMGSWVKPRNTQPFQTADRSVSTRSSGSSS